ncbi:MAG: hypothetical protein AAB729_01595 [Patescibacteria group bacterium]
MILYIDTTDFSKVTFAVSEMSSRPSKAHAGIQKNRFRTKSGMTWQKSFVIDRHKSYLTLQKLDEFFKLVGVQSSLPASSPRQEKRGIIRKIYVNKGPGSYTGTRIGITIGQALSLAWDVPVKLLSKDKFKTADTRIKNR